MQAVVHAGAQLRWFEQLCRLRHGKLRELVSKRGMSLSPGVLPSAGGVYCFWWSGDLRALESSVANRCIELAGPGGRIVHIKFDTEWLGLSAGQPVPLYVGKTADNLAKRVGQHLRLRDQRTTPVFEGKAKQLRPTTSCQLRAGVEHFFPRMQNTRDLILENLGLSYVVLGGDSQAANRFYLEDLAIGLMRPPLNIDIER